MLFGAHCKCGNHCAPIFVAIQIMRRLERGQNDFYSLKGSTDKALASIFVKYFAGIWKLQCFQSSSAVSTKFLVKVSDFWTVFLLYSSLNIIIINSSDLTKIDYTDSSNHLIELHSFAFTRQWGWVSTDIYQRICQVLWNVCEETVESIQL